MGIYDAHKLLIANRGEIAVRILKTAKKIGLRTVAVYTPSDALSPHVVLANEAVPLPLPSPSDASSSAFPTEAPAYLDARGIVEICKARGVTLVHPGYGFLAENADFAALVVGNGIGWIGPSPEVIRLMGIKHAARKAAVDAGVAIVPGSDGLVATVDEAVDVARRCGFPVMLKATAGGGGMGMVICHDEGALRNKISVTKSRAKALFNDDGVFLERYFPMARHIEIQVFGNGLGVAVHMRERECSIQRRHQKVIEESPSPFCESHAGLRERMCEVSVKLAQSIKYESAGTVEFLVDEETTNFYFLEMNTRIQVEHPVTEQIHSGLDLIELMIKQAVAHSSSDKGLRADSSEMQQETYDELYKSAIRDGSGHAIEGRIYGENPYEGFVPSAGLLQHVSFGEPQSWLRIDTWVDTGMSITPFFDPLLAKVIVSANTRAEAIQRLLLAFELAKIWGPPNNIEYLCEIGRDDTFYSGLATTTFLGTFTVNARAFKVLSSGIDTTIQDLPGRTIRLGMPRSGPMDDLAFSVGNILVGNPRNMEGLEIVVVPGVKFALQFFTSSVVSVTGREALLRVDGVEIPLWSRIIVPENGKLEIQATVKASSSSGFRTYLCVRGGFPNIPLYLGSKSTSMGLGGYQGRSLTKGDYIFLGDCSPVGDEVGNNVALPKSFLPAYPSDWVVYVLSGPHDDEEFITKEGIDRFYSTKWRVSPSSNRLGIRLDAPTAADRIRWARDSGGEGGSHPSNILDNGYAPGTININGDTPIILTNEGPDMGGYLCMCTVATSEMWKLGQLSPGSSVQFRRIGWHQSIQKLDLFDAWLSNAAKFIHSSSSSATGDAGSSASIFLDVSLRDAPHSPILHTRSALHPESDLAVTFRQAGDSAILVEFGKMLLDIFVRTRIHAFQTIVRSRNIPGAGELCPCIRSILCYYDPRIVSQEEFLRILVESEYMIPQDMTQMQFPGRRITFPIVLDDHWNREALMRYMHTTREKAVYLPSNVEYLARNNGIASAADALQKLIESDWLVLGVGFYWACPFLVPIDPRCRLIGQKMNPSRTFTPRGAIGIAGPVAAIYPIESPGGYQLYGRTLPGWQTWGKGKDFDASKPWLLEAFDQVNFTPVTEGEYIKLEQQFDAGQYSFKIEPVIFSVEEHSHFLESIADEIEAFRKAQKESSDREAERERTLLQEWENERNVPSESSVTKPSKGLEDVPEERETPAELITSSMYATIWKINIKPGDIIPSDSTIVVILEAKKTEIPMEAGEGNGGRKVLKLGPKVKEGASVEPGDILAVLD